MPGSQACPQCHSPMPAGASEGLCPACLLRRGLEPDTVPDTTESSSGWTPPTPADLSTRFPELDLLEIIGRGGMGAVYKARQKQLDRIIALKILPPEIGHDTAFAERFAREAQAMARLNHPHIVTIHDFGQRGELFFFVMEYVDGLNLRQLLETGNISTKEALAIVPQICDALQYAHDQAIVHRDIKPENILLSRRGDVKIADFGLAKLMGHAPVVGTAPERVMGTPQYMAPEQTERPAEVDHRADIYALGVVFYQMLTGELPAGAFQPPSRKVVIDVRLDEVVLRALEKSPERRYQHASDIRTAVETIVSTPSAAPPPPNCSPQPTEQRFSRLAQIGVIWAVVSLLANACLMAIEGQPVTPWMEMSTPQKLGFLLTEGLFVIGIPGILGAPVFGCFALLQIRRSAGRLRGCALALFDVLLFPLLAFDGLMAHALKMVVQYRFAHHNHFRFGAVSTNIKFTPTQNILLVVLCSLLDLVIIRWAWRAVTKWVQRETSSSARRPTGRFPALRDWLMVVTAAFAAVVLISVPTYVVLRSVAARAAPIPPTPAASFGPAIERVLVVGQDFLDLASGDVTGLRPESLQNPMAPGTVWVLQHSDTFVDQMHNDLILRGKKYFESFSEFVAVKPNSWETMPPDEVVSELRTLIPEGDGNVESIPATFLFRTRGGDEGILQVMSSTDVINSVHNRVRIRYKLVQK
jgi:tRNA A-37 threonylcarbamoyl transferase component Bud32